MLALIVVPEGYIKIIQNMYGDSNPGNDKGRMFDAKVDLIRVQQSAPLIIIMDVLDSETTQNLIGPCRLQTT